jgi:hypothetical protein
MNDDDTMTSGKRHKQARKDKTPAETDKALEGLERTASAESEEEKSIIKLHQRIEREENRLAGADNLLSRMYRSIAYTRGIDGSSNGMLRWRNCLNQYIAKLDRRYRKWKARFTKEDGGVQANFITPNKNSVRGNVQKQLLAKKMSWYIFVRTMRILQVPRIDISIRAYWPDGRSTLHEDTIIFDDEAVDASITSDDFIKRLEDKEGGDDDRHDDDEY